MTTRKSKELDDWSDPVCLGPFHRSFYVAGCPEISADGTTLYFQGEMPGGFGLGDLCQVPIDLLEIVLAEKKEKEKTIDGK